MKKRPLLLVEWDDITTDRGWEDEESDCTNPAAHCVSVGWQLKSNRRYLVITAMRSHGSCNDRQIIPRGCIRSIRRIE